MHITFNFLTGPLRLEIELADHPGAQSWADHFLPLGHNADAHVESPFVIWDYDANTIATYLENCKQLIKQLSELIVPYSGTVPDTIDQITREFTNSLHRYFTHSQRAVHDRFDRELLPGETISQEDIALQKQIIDLLVPLNDNIHLIERYLMPVVDKVELNEIYMSGEPAYDNPGWWFMNMEHRKYHTSTHADVILGSQILGKTILRSYCDSDNPNDWDTFGHYSNMGALQIQTGPEYRQGIYDSENFKNWLAKWGMTPETTWYDYPIGNIKNKEILPEILKQLKDSKNQISVSYGL